MARMLDKVRSIEILHSLSTEDLNDLVDEIQAEYERTWDTSIPAAVREKHPKPVRVRNFMPIIEAFNRDCEAQFKKPSRAHAIVDSGMKMGYIPAEVAATLDAIVDLCAEPVAEAKPGEPDNLDDLL